MSAFFVTYGTVDDAVQSIIEAGTGSADPNALGRALLAMNAEAMRQRYPQIIETYEADGRTEYQSYRDAARVYRVQPASDNPVQRAKSCACLAYQCAEGTVPEMALYRLLSAVSDAMIKAHLLEDARDDRIIWDRMRLTGVEWSAPRAATGTE